MLPRKILFCLPVLALAQTRDYPVKPVPFTAVHLTDKFWAPRIEINRTVTIPFAFAKDEETGRVDNFIRAAKALRGQLPDSERKTPGYPFDDTDVYKVIEGAAYTLSVHPDPKLEAYCDDLIAKIAAAQEPDGYLYTTRAIDPVHPHPWASPERWKFEAVDSHELYNLGHLYEAAAAYYQATGKKQLLDVAVKSAEMLDHTFGPGKRAIFPGHQIIEMGLAKLFRSTGDDRYIQLAKFMLDVRGPDGRPGAGRIYNQSHQKVIEQTEAVGHAVRATYMYSGMADVAALTGDESYVKAIDRIWQNVVARKLYITGGIGATSSSEAFGKDYELPNMTAYNETCAAVGNDYWNHRLFLLHADSRYIDVMERTLYNGVLSGVSLDGKTFFYPNPLESNGQHSRSPWFGVACCPSNITRFMASLPGYVYGQRGDSLWVNLFMAGKADVKLDNGRTLKIEQQTLYPWDGRVRIVVTPDQPKTELTVRVRIPGWARNEPVPGDLYHYADRPPTEKPTLRVNGAPVSLAQLDKGYATITRAWNPGDAVELSLPMPVRRVAANPQVEADHGRVALERGPIVYTTEWADFADHKVRNLMLPAGEKLTPEVKPDLLGGVTVLKGRAVALAYNEHGSIERTTQPFTAIPYYAWANRGTGQMMVWLPETEAAARPTLYPTLATKSTITVSGPSRTSGSKNPRNIADGEDPKASDDASAYYDWWPSKGTSEWAEMKFAEASTVSECELYWFDDTGHGQVRVPASWRLLYRDGDASWKPVEAIDAYTVQKNMFNRVRFRPIKTSALRLEATAQKEWSVGIQEWKVK